MAYINTEMRDANMTLKSGSPIRMSAADLPQSAWQPAAYGGALSMEHEEQKDPVA